MQEDSKRADKSILREEHTATNNPKTEKLLVIVAVTSFNLPKIGHLIETLLTRNRSVLLIEMDSSKEVASLIKVYEEKGVRVLKKKCNLGSMYPLLMGLKVAINSGFTHALTVDPTLLADVKSLTGFIRLTQKFPHSLILGCPVNAAGEPVKLGLLRKISNFFTALTSLNLSIEDAYCPIRVYPLKLVDAVLSSAKLTKLRVPEPEILIRLMWAGARVKTLDVTYSDSPRSFMSVAKVARFHFLYLLMLLTRFPILLWSRFFGWSPEVAHEAKGQINRKGLVKVNPKPNATMCPKSMINKTPEEAQRAKKALQAAFVAQQEAEKKREELNNPH